MLDDGRIEPNSDEIDGDDADEHHDDDDEASQEAQPLKPINFVAIMDMDEDSLLCSLCLLNLLMQRASVLFEDWATNEIRSRPKSEPIVLSEASHRLQPASHESQLPQRRSRSSHQ